MLELNHVNVAFGDHTVLQGQSLTLPRGGKIALMGPSGCGKTTLLRVAMGLQAPASGAVERKARRTAAVFQEPRLLPWCTALENVNAVLSDTAGTLPESRAWLERLGLGEACDLYPNALSGGMQQRVSIARALAYRADLLVLDEPFKAMDDALRAHVIATVGDAVQNTAVLLATHSAEEAKALGCEIYVYQNGRFDGQIEI